DDIPSSVILDMIRSLPQGYRTVFNLYVFEEKSHKEIASILNIAENSSASQFHRAKSILVKKIKEYKSILR
ncbi:MAG TPA: sigma-70 region 4 domain-containing protein, partial [Bacteroidales bacterium]|nr:sigma-70 region 4 domain-containing protein [Bacteroidales bacterium]